MHRCLIIDEILLEIFRQVLLMEHSSTAYLPVKSKTVAGLARTCRTFRNPALAVLWHELNGVAQLFCVLPATKLRWKDAATGPGVNGPLLLNLEHPPTREEWATFFEYGARVRHLYIGDTSIKPPGRTWTTCDVDPGALSAIPSTRAVFPNLQSLDANVTIGLRCNAYNPSLHGLLEKLGNHSRGVQSFNIHNETYTNYQTTLPLEDSVKDISKLKMLSAMWFELSPRLFENSHEYTHLRVLKIGHTTVSMDGWFPSGPLQFPSLIKLGLISPIGPNLQTLENLLSRFRCQSLRSLEVLISGDTPPEASLRSFFHCIAETCNIGGTLSDMYITQIYGDSDNDTQPLEGVDMALRFETLKPLTSLSRLNTIHLDIPSPFSMGDQDCYRLAKAWAEVVSVQLGASSSEPFQPTATISSLRHFAAFCPRLETLDIPFQPVFSTAIPWNKPIESRSVVTTLYVRESKVLSHLTKKVAACLSGLFPKLRKVHSCAIGETLDLSKGWKKVNSLLSILASVRRQEQLLAKQRYEGPAEGDVESVMEDSDSEGSSSSPASTTDTGSED
ncbi:hypothetical protein BKA70DRAFT_1287743 [Coprinopsis sp. MPI-PUGE-AT-0042]|nr:hypothetical protein BKA70DRAFT_1287743 [Coprinopsis sp. MPI-PUGE-AT-0042]